MINLFGLPLGTVFQGSTLVAILGLIGVTLRVYITGLPARALARNEARRIETDEHTLIRTDYVQQIKDWRVEVHGLRSEMNTMQGEQRKLDKVIRNYEDDRRSMLFLIRLLIAELERLDPNSIIVAQAKITLEQIIRGDDPLKSNAVSSVKRTVHAAQVTLDEVSQVENL